MPATTVHDHGAPTDWRPLDKVVRLVAAALVHARLGEVDRMLLSFDAPA